MADTGNSPLTLGQKQELFASLFGEFICWAYKEGYALRLGEVHRPQVTADYYASIGKGSKKSLHTKKLAADVFLVKDGKVTWSVSDYEPLGKHWKSLHPLCAWGGDFVSKDAVHFSMSHGGVR